MMRAHAAAAGKRHGGRKANTKGHAQNGEMIFHAEAPSITHNVLISGATRISPISLIF
jgi:hypothetical protein